MQAQGRRTQPEVPTSTTPAPSGSSYRFLVRSAEEAVGAIRHRLGDQARVVSVRSVKAPGLRGVFGGTRLEVIAQIPPAPAAAGEDEKSRAATETPAETMLAPATDSGLAGRTTATLAQTAYRTGTARPGVNSERSRIEILLRRSGISETVMARLEEEVEWSDLNRRPLHEGLSAVAEQLRKLAGVPTARALPSRAAFLGLPGVGRTTALCKWMSAEVFTRGRHGSAVGVEFDRAAGGEELAVFAELLGVEFSRLPPVVPAEAPDSFCFLDVPPFSLTRSHENTRLRRYLDAHQVPGRVLVISALHEAALIRQACAVGAELGCTHLVVTRLDELAQWGKLWDCLLAAPFTPLLLSTGPSTSGDCETEVVGAVLRRTFPWN